MNEWVGGGEDDQSDLIDDNDLISYLIYDRMGWDGYWYKAKMLGMFQGLTAGSGLWMNEMNTTQDTMNLTIYIDRIERQIRSEYHDHNTYQEWVLGRT